MVKSSYPITNYTTYRIVETYELFKRCLFCCAHFNQSVFGNNTNNLTLMPDQNIMQSRPVLGNLFLPITLCGWSFAVHNLEVSFVHFKKITFQFSRMIFQVSNMQMQMDPFQHLGNEVDICSDSWLYLKRSQAFVPGSATHGFGNFHNSTF